MDYFQAEDKLQRLNTQIIKEKSPRFILAKILQFILEITDDSSIDGKEAFVSDFLLKTNLLLKKYSAFGLDPQSTKEILSALKRITSVNEFNVYTQDWNSEILRIENELIQLETVLSGQKDFLDNRNKFYFPVLEKTASYDYHYSLIDSLQITLQKSKTTEFILHPSAVDVEQRIKKQVEASWKFAKNYVAHRYNKKSPILQIVIKFEKSYAVYEGGSLGIALTIGLISELMKYFELRHNLNFAQNIVSSGSIVESGDTLSMTEEIICTKLKAVFFSKFSIFVLPQNDERAANECYKKLKDKYPKRDLEIIGVKNISDIINLRNLIELKKINLFSWGTRKVLRNKTAVLLLIFSVLLLFIIYFWRMDDNPVRTEFKDNHINVLNKYGEVLWRTKFNLSNDIVKLVPSYIDQKTRIIDVNRDGQNEVLISNSNNGSLLSLFNCHGEVQWSFDHADTLRTANDTMKGFFNVQGIIDTLHASNRIELLVIIQHYTYYPSGILKLDLETGEQISDILWHPGSITSSKLIDWNQDGIKEIIAGGPSNGMKKAYLLSIDHNRLQGTFPTSEKHYFKDMKLANFNHYLLFPMTDYGKLYFPIYNAVTGNPTIINNNLLSLSIREGRANLFEESFGYGVRINKDFEVENIIISDQIVVKRDSLVNAGILNHPFTDSPEFHDLIIKNIEYWNGSEFVPLFKKDKE